MSGSDCVHIATTALQAGCYDIALDWLAEASRRQPGLSDKTAKMASVAARGSRLLEAVRSNSDDLEIQDIMCKYRNLVEFNLH